jgi:hypothetical protein
MKNYERQHTADIVTGIYPGKYPKRIYYRAVCTCGLLGIKRPTRAEAQNDATDHLRTL